MGKKEKKLLEIYFTELCTPDECIHCELSQEVDLGEEKITLCQLITDSINIYLRYKGIKS